MTCMEARYRFNENSGLSSYPLYHTVYDTFHLVDKIMDPGFKVCIVLYLEQISRYLYQNLLNYGLITVIA